MGEAFKGIHREQVHLDAGGGRAPHRFRVETSLQQVFDLYIPEALYRHEATLRFVERLRSLTAGATLYQAVEGDWKQEIEAVRVLRLSITTVDGEGRRIWDVDDIRQAVRQQVAEFMVDLHDSTGQCEEAVFFNDWTARGTTVTRM